MADPEGGQTPLGPERSQTPSQLRVLVIGGRGFIGSHFVPAASAAGFEVVTTSREEGAADLRADLLDPPSLEAAIGEAQPGVVVNLGALASVVASWDEPAAGREVNVGGTRNLLQAAGAAARPPHVVCLSSAEVYGSVPEAEMPIAESRPARPLTPYGVAKAAMEEACRREADGLGLSVTVLRSFNQLGPGQPQQYVAAGIASQIAEAEAGGGGRAVVTLGNPDAARDFTDVRDGARALTVICELSLPGTFNLCSGTATSVAELAAELASLAALPVEIEVDSTLARPADVPVVRGSAARLREATGWKPEIPLPRTLADMLESAREDLGSGAGP